MATVYNTIQDMYAGVWVNVRPVVPLEAEVVVPADAPPPPPPPANYNCNPSHVIVHANMTKPAIPMVFNQFYTSKINTIEYAIDPDGRSYIVFHIDVTNG